MINKMKNSWMIIKIIRKQIPIGMNMSLTQE